MSVLKTPCPICGGELTVCVGGKFLGQTEYIKCFGCNLIMPLWPFPPKDYTKED